VPERCTRHPGARAGWRCRSCGAALCPGCTFLRTDGRVELPACGRCRGFADPITLPRSELRPFPPRILEALGWPFRGSGLLSLAGLGAVLWLLKKLGFIGALLAFGVWWAFIFHVIRRGAVGDDEIDPPDFSDVFYDVVAPALRGILATALLWIPAVAYALMVLRAGGSLANVGKDPVLWLFVGAGLAYGPAAILVASCGGGLLRLFNPAIGIFAIARLGRDYWVAALAVGALLGLNVAVGLVAALVASTRVPVLSGWAAQSMTSLLPMIAARILGLLLFVRGDSVGMGDPHHYREPVLGAVRPRGAEPVLETASASEAPTAQEPIELDASPAPSVSGPTAPVRGPREAALAAPPPANTTAVADPVSAIADALAASDGTRAAALFAAYRGPDRALAPRTLFQLARAASESGDHALSARALHAAGTGTDASVAPHALLVLSRVLERRLARPADALRVLEHLLARWPDSDAARQARAALDVPPR
jgi:hypothetical protein